MLFVKRQAREVPPPRSETTLRSTPSRLISIPAAGPRWHTAVVSLEDALSAWALPVHLARRWMHPARHAFEEHQVPLEMFVQLDPVGGLVSIELWDEHGAKVYGADAYLGAPEKIDITDDRRTRVG